MKIGLISLGCPKNLVDSEVMLGLARQADYELTQDPAGADALVVNTCAFIDSAKKESVEAILEMAKHKKDGACRRLIVTGYLAERYRHEIVAQIPEIDAVLGTGEVGEIVRAIAGVHGHPDAVPLTFYTGAGAPPLAVRGESPSAFDERCILVACVAPPSNTGGILSRRALPARRLARLGAAPDFHHGLLARTHADVLAAASLDRGSAWPQALQSVRGTQSPAPSTRPRYIYDADTPRVLSTPPHYAFLKIAEGCNYKCAFCIIPTLRGAYRSRPSGSIVREARALAARGVKELLLISQDTTFYGIDRQERGALAHLLGELNTVEGLEWIRLLYLYPTTIDDRTLDAMAGCDKVYEYIDLPLQHASNAVLKRMKRPGTRRHYDRLLHRIRSRVPGVALRTTFIAGFPGETDADVDELCDFVKEHGFDHVGVFMYSHEEGTSAYGMTNDVPARTKAARRNRVMSLQKRLVRTRQRARIGERVRVIVDGPTGDQALVLKTRLRSQPPDIDPAVYLTECDPCRFKGGEFAEVDIVGAHDYDLIARPAVL